MAATVVRMRREPRPEIGPGYPARLRLAHANIPRSRPRHRHMIPDYQTLMLPILQLASDGQEHRIGDVIASLGKKVGLRPDELAEMLPSGRQPISTAEYTGRRLTSRKLSYLRSLDVRIFASPTEGRKSWAKIQIELMFGCWSNSRSSTNSKSALAHLRRVLAFLLRLWR
jgi:hypothetical protein